MSLEIRWHDLAGMIGVALVLLAYFGLQAGRLRGDGLVFQSMNLVGALLIVVSLLFAFNLAAFVVESFWVAISVYGIVRSRRLRRQAKAQPTGPG